MIRLLVLLLWILSPSCTTRVENKTTSFKLELNRLKTLADSLYQDGQFANALEHYGTLIALDSTEGEFYFKRGNCYAHFQLFELSTDDYLKSYELGFRRASSCINLGLNEIMFGNDSTAVAYFKKALELDPSNSKAAELLKGMGTPDEKIDQVGI